MSRWRRPCGAVVLAALSVSAACTPAFRIESKDHPKPGVPFYLKSMVYRQHTIYEYTWLRVSLSQAPVAPPLAPGGEERIGKRNTRVAEVANTTVNRTAIDDIQQLIAQLPAKTGPTEFADAVRAIDAAFSKLGKLRADHLRSPDTSTFRNTGNYVERVSVVDYDAVYYLNGRIPPFGSNSMSAELGPDGTLAKAASDAKGGVGEAITAVATAVTGVAPIKEFVASKWMPTAPDAAAVKTNNVPPALRGYFEPGVLSFRVELETDIQGYVFDFTNDTKSPTFGRTLDRVVADIEKGVFVGRPIERGPEKTPDDAVTFSGKVQLPPAPKKP